MLFQAPKTTEQDEAILEQIRQLWVRLQGILRKRPHRWTQNLRRSAYARALQGSNSIEGYHVSVDDALAAADSEPPLTAEQPSWAAVQGYQDAMTYVLQLAEDEHFALDVTLLRSLQFMMIKHELQKHPGSWRPGDIFVRNEATGEKVYQAPGADHVPDLMQELVDSLVETRRSSRVIRAAMAHLNLVMIHPFSDGNGRMARCLQTLVLARGGVLDPAFCSIEEYLGANTQEYYDVLGVVGGGDWNPERDASPWVRFVLTAHYRQATTLMRRQQELGLIWDDLEREISKRELPDRSLPLLSDACLGFSIRNVTYRKHADVSQVVASRDLNAITKSGLFEPHGEGRGRTYKATPELLAIRDRHRRKRPIPDPYELSDTVAAIGRER